MASSWRSRKILSLIPQSQTKTNNEELLPIEHKSYEIEEENQENISPEAKTVGEQLTRKTTPTQDFMPIETETVSLVPDYSSDSNMSENETAGINDSANHASENLTQPTPANNTRRSRSPSSSSSRSSSSSSDSTSSSSSSSSSSTSSSSSSSKSSTPVQNPSPQNVGTDCEEKTTSHPNSPQISERQQIQLREQRNKNSQPSYSICPIYTDLSDVDLSDDDPSVDFNIISYNRLVKRKSYLFEDQKSYSSDSDCNSEQNIRGRKRSRNVEKWQQIKSKRLRNKSESYVSVKKS